MKLILQLDKVKIIMFILLFTVSNVFAFNSIKNNFVFVDDEVEQLEVFNKNVSHLDTNAYHLFSHGRSGELLINGIWLNAKEIATFLNLEFNIQNIEISQLNIYGCEFAKGEKGLKAVSYLENRLGIKVNASTNITGTDGDWILEVGNANNAINLKDYQYNLQATCTTPSSAPVTDGSKAVGILTDGVLSNNVTSTNTFTNQVTGAPNLPNYVRYSGASVEHPSTNSISVTATDGTYQVEMASGNVHLVSTPNVFVHSSRITSLEFATSSAGATVTYTNVFDHTNTQLMDLTDLEMYGVGSYGGGADMSLLTFTNPTPGTFVVTYPSNSTTQSVYYNLRAINGNLVQRFVANSVGVSGGDNITTKIIRQTASIGLAKEVNKTSVGSSLPFTIEMDFAVENFATDLNSGGVGSLSIQESISDQFGVFGTDWTFTSLTKTSGPASFNINTGYNGTSDTELLASTSSLAGRETGKVKVAIQVLQIPENAVESGDNYTFDITESVVSGISELSSTPLCDVAISGTNPDPTNNNYGGDDESVPFSFAIPIDTDGDGVTNADDLDDDNDGILDIDEECKGFISQNYDGDWIGETQTTADITVSPSNFTERANGQTYTTDQIAYNMKKRGGDAILEYTGNFEYTVNFPAPGVPANEIAFFLYDLDVNASAYLEVTINGGTPAGSIFEEVDAGITTTADYDPVTSRIVDTGVADQRILIGSKSNTLITEFKVKSFNMSSGEYLAFSLLGKSYCDSDNDGLRNTFDLDSDGDNCPDAIEGAGSFVSGDLVPSSIPGGSTNITSSLCNGPSCVDADGVPFINGTSLQQGLGNAHHYGLVTECCLEPDAYDFVNDYDYDGLGDNCDLDDDNDGILDQVENNYVNLALSGTASQSSDWSASYPASNATDGNITNLTSTLSEDAPWWEIDLGSIQDVSFINIYNRTVAEIRLVDYHVFVSDVPFVSNDIATIQAQSGVTDLYQTLQAGRASAIDINRTGRYLRIQLSDDETILNMAEVEIFNNPNLDTDGDSIINSLDLDSDGDGCPDAVEGAESYEFSNLVEDTNIDGGSTSVQYNLGTAVTSEGIPTAGSQGVGSSQTFGLDTECCSDASNYSAITDTDGDGIGDECDLDDDNDGILDVDEGHTGFDYTKLNTPTTLVEGTSYTTPTTLLNGEVVDVTAMYTGGSATVVYNASSTIDGYLYNSSTNNGQTINGVQRFDYSFSEPQKYLRISAVFNDHIGVANSTSNEGFSLNINGSSDFHVFDPANTSSEMNIDNTIGGGTIAYSRFLGYYTIFDPNGISSISLSSRIYAGDAMSNAAAYNVAIGSEADQDTDKDGIYDRLDLDSDGDGCPDTLEAGVPRTNGDLQDASVTNGNGTDATANTTATVTNAQLDPNGIDANNDGLNDSVDTAEDGTPDYTSTYTVNALDANVQGVNCSDPCEDGASTDGTPTTSDSDGDGINDVCDLDDDNDGILDTVECPGPETIDSFSGFSSITTTAGAQTFTASGGEIVTVTPSSPTNAQADLMPTGYWLGNNNSDEEILFNLDKAITEIKIFGTAHSYVDAGKEEMLLEINGVSYIFSPSNFVVTNEDPSVSSSGSSILGSTQGTGNAAGDGDFNYTVIVPLGITSFKLIHNYIDGVPSGTIYDVKIGGEIVEANYICDTDGDGISNDLDLDSDGDGCPDAVEAGGTFVNDDLTSSGNLADADEGSVDDDGVPITDKNGDAISSQAATTAYTTNEMLSIDAIASVPVDSEVCVDNDITFTATASGTTTDFSTDPDTVTPLAAADISYQWYESTDGGVTFTEISGENTNALTLTSVPLTSNDNQYKLEITSANNSCPTEQIETLTVIDAPDAGTLTGQNLLCEGDNTLLTVVDGDAGGAWTSSDDAIATVTDGVVTAVSGGDVTISYTAAPTSPCTVPAVSTFDITVRALPMAGVVTGSAALCVNATETYTAVGGDAGGTWESLDTEFATVTSTGLVTAVAPGVATLQYTVEATAPCTVDSVSTLQVTILENPIAEAGTAAVACPGTTTTLDGVGSTTAGVTYQWTTTDGTIDSGDTTLNPVVSAAGTYTLKVENTTTGCFAEDTVTVTEAVSVDTDGDGLTDCEETTGIDDPATSGTPVGTSDPNNPCDAPADATAATNNTVWQAADCDGDGETNGFETTNNTLVNDPCSVTAETTPTNPGMPGTAAQTAYDVWAVADCDMDSLTNGEEVAAGTDPFNGDSDGDGVTDGIEVNTDMTSPTDGCEYTIASQDATTVSAAWEALDCDNDGLTNGEEIAAGTDPLSNGDTDGDGVLDAQEVVDNTSPTNGCDYTVANQDATIVTTAWEGQDCDGDGLTNAQEIAAGTDPLSNLDTDGDGVLDAQEVMDGTSHTDGCAYTAANQDAATVTTAWEALDCDGDGLTNGEEIAAGTDPLSNGDSDGDGVLDAQEVMDNTSPTDGCKYNSANQDIATVTAAWEALDCDMDGQTNGQEVVTGSDPLNGDTDGDGVTDGQEILDMTSSTDPCEYNTANQDLTIITAAWTALDCDGDGETNGLEVTNGTTSNDPCSVTSETVPTNPGMPGTAVQTAYDVWTAADCDMDGLTNGEEVAAGTDPFNGDSDGDGVLDGVEVNTDMTSPTDGCAYTIASQDATTVTAAWNALDCDMDGVTNGEEIAAGTDPLSNGDSDGDGVLDAQEVMDNTDVNDGCEYNSANQDAATVTVAWEALDCDMDGLTNGEEITAGTDPLSNGDSDGDGVLDAQEVMDNTSVTDGCEYNSANQDSATVTAAWEALDCDMDGLTNGEEIAAGTDPLSNGDSDGDGVLDAQEVMDNTDVNDGCEYNSANQDSATVTAAWEALDCDMDGLTNGEEITAGTDPLSNGDSDGDGVLDAQEVMDNTDVNDGCEYNSVNQDAATVTAAWNALDCDMDGLTNGEEIIAGTDPLSNGDSDGDGVLDAQEVMDNTGVNDGCEYSSANQDIATVTAAWEALDCDMDGQTNGQEVVTGSDPLNGDTDGDGVTDGQEILDMTSSTDPCEYNTANQDLTIITAAWTALDCDGDGETNGLEVTNGTTSNDPCSVTSETVPTNPGMPGTAVQTAYDVWTAADCDMDGLTNGEEVAAGTDPFNGDSDGDGVLDGVEVNTDMTSPTDGCAYTIASQDATTVTAAWNALDCDMDGVTNGEEIAAGTDPLSNGDSDGDGVLDAQEVMDNTDVNDGCEYNSANQDAATVTVAWEALDCDMDGLTNGEEITAGTDPLSNGDSDGDGVLDAQEVMDNTSVTDGCEYNSANQDSATVTAAWEALDCDMDGLTNGEEIIAGTDPLSNGDSDGDGVLDAQEVMDNTGVNDGCEYSSANQDIATVTAAWEALDCDMDGQTNGQEVVTGSDPLNGDTDGDGVTDGQEILDMTSSTDPCEYNTANQDLTIITAAWTALDCDGDGETNGLEVTNGTTSNDPCSVTSETVPTNPGMPGTAVQTAYDVWTAADCDMDGLTNGEEVAAGTDPFNGDSDGDGVLDGVEVNTDMTSPTDGCAYTIASQDATTVTAAWNALDCDMDGVTNGEEIAAGTDPLSNGDSDGDGVLDAQEVMDNTDVNDGCEYNSANQDAATVTVAWEALDCDMDGLTNGEEITAGTDPLSNGDSDGDGVLDAQEVMDNTSVTDGCEYNSANQDSATVTAAWEALDCDMDGLTNGEEIAAGTDPLSNGDSDGDGVLDAQEVMDNTDVNDGCEYNSANQDSATVTAAWEALDCDMDGLTNGEEITAGTDPLSNGDSDGDGVLDAQEVMDNTSVTDGCEYNSANQDSATVTAAWEALDCDMDGLTNGEEIAAGTDPLSNGDSDGDGVLDAQEVMDNTDVNDGCEYNSANQDAATVTAAWEALDCDMDGLTNGEEIAAGTDPLSNGDSDGDGVLDAQEVMDNTDVNDGCEYNSANQDSATVTAAWEALDCDMDGLTNGEEITAGTDPLSNGDSDGDGVLDAQEVMDNTDVNDGCEYNSANQDIATVSAAWEALDCDMDGQTNGQEVTTGSDPLNGDTDGDGVSDGQEILDMTSSTDPCEYNTANQDLTIITSAWIALDCDGDGETNGLEVTNGTTSNDPCSVTSETVPTNPGMSGTAVQTAYDVWTAADCDMDGLTNGEELTLGTDPFNGDSDGDGVDDGVEVNTDMTSPTDGCEYTIASQDATTVTAAWNALDCDMDGVTNGEEITAGTDPLSNGDSDGDGVLDAQEVMDNTDVNDGCEYNSANQDSATVTAAWEALDCDMDGLTNGEEITAGTDPLSNGDSDGDGVLDAQEVMDNTDVNDGCEYNSVNQDAATVTAAWEALDCDMDGQTNGQEVVTGSDPLNGDTDGDGVSDGQEILDMTSSTDPCEYNTANQDLTIITAAWIALDCDGDGETNGLEVTNGTISNDPCSVTSETVPTNPGMPGTSVQTAYDIWASADCDGDGTINGQEVIIGTDPFSSCDVTGTVDTTNPIWQAADCDGDGVSNGDEITDGTDPNNPCDGVGGTVDTTNEVWQAADCDGDGVSNGDEITDGTDPTNPCDGVGTIDTTNEVWQAADCDGDGVTNGQEITDGTDPTNPCDGVRTADTTNEVWQAADCDGDGVTNGDEITDGTDPNNPCDGVGTADTTNEVWQAADCDGDGVTNGQEITDGTDPTNSCDGTGTADTTNEVWQAADCDGDGVTNGQEIIDGTNPTNGCDYEIDNQDVTIVAATWNALDCDGDGVTNGQELIDGTDPTNSCDGTGTAYTTNEVWQAADCDRDGVTNGQEIIDETNPEDPCSLILASQTETPSDVWNDGDCDGGGVTNGQEVLNGTNPFDDTDDSGVEVNNVITPNGDGDNDVFIIDGLQHHPSNTVQIYNRWGVLVYDVIGYNNADRAFKGYSGGRATISKDDKLPVGTYYYVIDYVSPSGANKSAAGYLYIQR